MVKYNILSNNGCSKLHAVIDCLYFFLVQIGVTLYVNFDKKTNAYLTFFVHFVFRMGKHLIQYINIISECYSLFILGNIVNY